MSLFNTFFESMEFDQRFSLPFITLIQKTGCSTSLNDFRPILLLGWVHTQVTGVLVERLKRMTGKLVKDTQSTFIWGMSIFLRLDSDFRSGGGNEMTNGGRGYF